MADTYPIPTLIDGNLRLRRPTMADVAARLAAGNDPEIQHMYGVDPASFRQETEQSAQSWVSYHVEQPYSWFIDIDGKLAGLVFLHSMDQTDRRASVAMGLLHPEQLGKGYGSRALNLLLAEAFGPLNLHRVSLRVLDYNARAIAAYKKVGFVEEGRERQSARVGDQFHDDVMMGLLSHDYAAHQETRA